MLGLELVFVEFGIEALPPAPADAHKMAPSSRSRTNVRKAIRKRYSTPRLRDPVQLLHASIVLTDPLFDIHEVPGSVSHNQPRVDGQGLVLYASQIASA